MAKKQLRPASAAEQFIKTTTAEEKPQPTAEELEAAGQQRLIDAKETQKAEKKKEQTKTAEPKKEEPKEQAKPPKMGQPKKYNEPTKHVSFSFPVSVVENLKILAGLRKTNQTQLILNLINRELETKAEKIKAYKELLK